MEYCLSQQSKKLITRGYALGITVESSAAFELQGKAGIKTDVFPLVHQELKTTRTASLAKTIFIIDEASMLSSQQGHELIKNIERTGARLILVGDKAQLPSVNAGRLFGLTQEYGIETTTMDEIVRQKKEVLKEAVMTAIKGDVKDALDKIEIKSQATHEERVAWIANHWLSLTPDTREKTLLFAPTHANRESIIKLLREGLKEEGTLSSKPFCHLTLKAKTIEPIQQRFVAYHQKGDRVRFNQDFKRHKISSGHYYTVATSLKDIEKRMYYP
ncbi:AAA family ATPase [Legionella busanensis]|uniref:AAA family ATPase n=1 Tax=Legionella busanensis TaxID=190655 RepID=UPI001F5E43F6|nr:AAA family ATPase [Legionella busanensis]